MIRGRRAPRPRPQHARPSVLAPSRSIAGLSGFAVVAVAVVAGCAAVTSGQGAGVARAARPAPIKAVHLPAGAVAFAHDAAIITTSPASTPSALAAPPTSSAAAPAPPRIAPVSGLAASGIPSTALAAYKNAARREAARKPQCGLAWPLLAGIGRVESNHGRFAGAVLHSDGLSTPRVVGIPLNGHGTAVIRDTDGGRLDGDTVYDRAVGPMQFIPSTWAGWGVDANNDGVKDPFNIFDAAAASADYLCAAGRDLTTSSGQVRAILSYNYSYDYVSTVMGLEKVYAAQTGLSVPVLPTGPGAPTHGRPRHKQPLPPVDPGTPGGVLTHPKPKPKPKGGVTSTRPTKASSSAPASGTSSSGSSTAPPTGSPSCPTPSPTDSSSSTTASSSADSSGASTSASGTTDPCAPPSSRSTAVSPAGAADSASVTQSSSAASSSAASSSAASS